jgi:hypothetical protein
MSKESSADDHSSVQALRDWKGLGFADTLMRLEAEELDLDFLKILKRHGTTEQRRALALMAKAPHQLVQQLSNEPDEDIAFAAKIGRKMPLELAKLGITQLSDALPRMTLDEVTLDRIAKYPNPNLQQAVAGNQSTPQKTLEFLRGSDNPTVARVAFEELQRRGYDPISELLICGTGCEIDVFELSVDQFQAIAEDGDSDLVDSPEWDLEDQGQFFLPDDAINNMILNGFDLKLTHVDASGNPRDDVGKQIIRRSVSSCTELGKYYLIRIWESKGIWDGFKFAGNFNEEKLTIELITVQFGNIGQERSLTLFEMNYQDASPSRDSCSTEGKGVTCYLVDQDGGVTEL